MRTKIKKAAAILLTAVMLFTMTVVAPVTAVAATPSEENWASLYLDYINGLDENYNDFKLVYLDDDDIPELYVIRFQGQAYDYLCHINSGEVKEMKYGYSSLYYFERANLFCLSGFTMGIAFDNVYCFDNQKEIQSLATGNYGTPVGGEPNYKWNGNDVTEEEYNNSLSAVFDKSAAQVVNYSNSNTRSEIVEILEEKQSAYGIRVYSDSTDLSVEVGDKINIGAGIFKNNEQITDISGITATIGNPDILSLVNYSEHDNCRFLTIRSKAEGTTWITFSDSKTGYTTRVPVTAYVNETATATTTYLKNNINTVLYHKGLYTDNFKVKENDDGSSLVSFDAYNTSQIFGVVEVYDGNDNMKNAVVIEKMRGVASSIKESVWDNSCWLIEDIWNNVVDHDNYVDYRQQLYSKHTPITVEIPKDGYIKITKDTDTSFLAGFINSVDILLNIKSVTESLFNFDTNLSNEYAKKITKEIITNSAYVQLIKDQDTYAKKLTQNLCKEVFFSNEAIGGFGETIVNNLNELNLMELIGNTATDCGISLGENIFEALSGPVGLALKGLFIFADLGNLIVEINHFIKFQNTGDISVLNQNNNYRSVSGVKVESDTNFDSETSLKVFKIVRDSELLDPILDALEELNPEMYADIDFEKTITYNISLIKDGEEVQPQQIVKVIIPIPDELQSTAYLLKVYREEDDGSLTDMNARVQDGCLVFETEHFSIYSIVPFKDNGNSPTPPTDPSTPTDPTSPTDPTDVPPTDPTNPSDPTDPSEAPTNTPTDPTNPTTAPGGSNTPTSSTTPTKSVSGATSSTTTTTTQSTGKEASGKVATGNSGSIVIMLAVLAVSSSAIIIFRKKKREE